MKINRVIYRLWHDKSAKGRVGYIGKDSYYPRRSNLFRRRKDTHSTKLYRALKKYPPSLWHVEILESEFKSNEELNVAEIFFIKKFDSKNKGYNCTDGGEGQWGRKVSEESRIKMRNSHLGKKLPLKQRLKIGKANMGHAVSLETREKLREANLGKKLSEEHKEKLRLAHLGYKPTKAARIKQSMAQLGMPGGMLGKKHSQESLEKMRLAQQARREKEKIIKEQNAKH